MIPFRFLFLPCDLLVGLSHIMPAREEEGGVCGSVGLLRLEFRSSLSFVRIFVHPFDGIGRERGRT